MSSREAYDRAVDAVRNIVGTGYAVVPLTADNGMVCAALDQYDKVGGRQSYSDIYQVMVANYTKRRGK